MSDLDEELALLEYNEDAASALVSLIVDECRERGWTLRTLAANMGGDDPYVDELALHFLIACDADVHMHVGTMAEKFARAFGTSAQFWRNLDEARRARAR